MGMYSTLHGRRERAAIVDWVARDNYTHAITLNSDRELSQSQARKIFGRFCHQFDRETHQIRNMRAFPENLRLRAIVFPENLSTNAHLHGFADFGPALRMLGNDWRLKQEVGRVWLNSTRGSGSVHFDEDPDRGWGRYCTKRSDGTYFLAADFHPH